MIAAKLNIQYLRRFVLSWDDNEENKSELHLCFKHAVKLANANEDITATATDKNVVCDVCERTWALVD